MRYDDLERDRGMISPADRKLIMGITEYEHRQTVHTRRGQIRNRIRNSLLDFRLLMEFLDEDERRRIFSWQEDREFGYQFGVRDALAFLYLSQREQGLAFQGVLEQGIGNAWRTLEGPNLQVDIDLDIEIHEPYFHDIPALIDKADEHGIDALDDEELGVLVRADDGLDIDFGAMRERREAERERVVEFAERVHSDEGDEQDSDSDGSGE